MSVTRPRGLLLAMVSAIALAACGPQQPVAAKDPNPNAGAETAKFLDAEIKDLSTLDRAAQEAELNWFATAAAPYQGMEITVVSENIATHEYESRVLAPAFSAITGIKVTHQRVFPNAHLGKIPVMVGSRLCLLKDQKHVHPMDLGECPEDVGGYFIVGGGESGQSLWRRGRTQGADFGDGGDQGRDPQRGLPIWRAGSKGVDHAG